MIFDVISSSSALFIGMYLTLLRHKLNARQTRRWDNLYFWLTCSKVAFFFAGLIIFPQPHPLKWRYQDLNRQPVFLAWYFLFQVL